eukprot:TRINITY_DN3240_c0_g1_i9.p3 TRINITY_DN3240_c0_g1~~TRINITY_DN3240_c0_g1_i9.p3  ORF type:complete len:523 (+),score=156.21 TRINITY_DN3240_c0_g1_i9:3514-5082(+)
MVCMREAAAGAAVESAEAFERSAAAVHATGALEGTVAAVGSRAEEQHAAAADLARDVAAGALAQCEALPARMAAAEGHVERFTHPQDGRLTGDVTLSPATTVSAPRGASPTAPHPAIIAPPVPDGGLTRSEGTADAAAARVAGLEAAVEGLARRLDGFEADVLDVLAKPYAAHAGDGRPPLPTAVLLTPVQRAGVGPCGGGGDASFTSLPGSEAPTAVQPLIDAAVADMERAFGRKIEEAHSKASLGHAEVAGSLARLDDRVDALETHTTAGGDGRWKRFAAEMVHDLREDVDHLAAQVRGAAPPQDLEGAEAAWEKKLRGEVAGALAALRDELLAPVDTLTHAVEPLQRQMLSLEEGVQKACAAHASSLEVHRERLDNCEEVAAHWLKERCAQEQGRCAVPPEMMHALRTTEARWDGVISSLQDTLAAHTEQLCAVTTVQRLAADRGDVEALAADVAGVQGSLCRVDRFEDKVREHQHGVDAWMEAVNRKWRKHAQQHMALAARMQDVERAIAAGQRAIHP